MIRIFVCVALAVSLVLSAARARAESSPPIYVVDVAGDRLDAARLRAAIGRELSVTAVATDDARASSATGRIEVRASAEDEKLTVAFRKVDAPVTRTVDLPDDATRAESTAVLLAGNVARDEASELVPPPPPKPKPPAEDGWEAAEDARATVALAQARALLATSADEGARRRHWLGGSMLVSGTAMVAASFLVEKWPAGWYVQLGGIDLAIWGSLTLLGRSDEDKLARIARGSLVERPFDTAARLDEEWKKEAAFARTARLSMGIASFILAGSSVALATFDVVRRPRPDTFAQPATEYLTGVIAGLAGAYLFAVPSPIESSYRSWKDVQAASAAPATNVSFGITPAPGGGGMASLAVNF